MNDFSQKPNTQQESGADLFARLVSQKKTIDKNSSQLDPKLNQLENILMFNKYLNIDPILFQNGLNNKEIIEIYGKVGVGKSELIMHLITRCLLPKNWRLNLNQIEQSTILNSENLNQVDSNICIDLSDYSCLEQDQIYKIVLIDTDSKFNMLRLFTIMEHRVGTSLTKFSNQNKDNQDIQNKLRSNRFQKIIQKFIRDCLKNLTVYQCFNSEQFILALCACEYFIQTLIANNVVKSQIIPIFIDTINSTFEIMDKYNNSLGLNDYDHTEKYSVQLIKKLVDRYNVCIIASRSDFRFSDSINSNADFSFKKWKSLLNKQIELFVTNNNKVKNYQDLDEEDDKNVTLIKKKYLKIVEFLKERKNDKQAEIEFKLIKDNLNYSIENFGFNI